jgi:biopolymer transport protein TolR
MGMSVGSGQGGPVSEPNIVPLIDVLLVLIIIFMVITPKTPSGLDALVPQPPPPNQKQQPDDNKTIVVQVAPNGKLKINQDDTSWEQLGPRLSDIFKQRADKIAFVKGNDDVEFGEVAQAIDIMRGSGIEHVGLITAKIEAGQ